MKIVCRLAIMSFFYLSLINCAIASPITVLYYTSSPDSWVGHGETVIVTPLEGFDFSVSRNYDNGVSFAINDFATNPDFWSTRWWYLDFAAPFNKLLSVGDYYDATRFPFQDDDTAGLSFIGNGRGDNRLTGGFKILEAVYATDGAVVSFAADFVQYDEEIREWWNVGAIRYNSEIPIDAVPEPGTYLLVASGMLLLILCRRHQLRV